MGFRFHECSTVIAFQGWRGIVAVMSTPPPPWYASDVSLGERLLSMVDAAGAHNGCEHWIKVVAGHLEQWRPDSGLRAKWLSMRGSILYVGNKPNIDTRSWRLFQDGVRQRLEWLAGLPAITDQKAAASVDHPITRSDLKVAIEEAVAGRNSGDDLPIEIQKSVARFREAFPNPTKCAFIMMGFGDTKLTNKSPRGYGLFSGPMQSSACGRMTNSSMTTFYGTC
jgi:hypothetical protein